MTEVVPRVINSSEAKKSKPIEETESSTKIFHNCIPQTSEKGLFTSQSINKDDAVLVSVKKGSCRPVCNDTPNKTSALDSSSDCVQRHDVDSPERRPARYEAFVMTGDKMLNLNPKISPSYAKMYREQLPPVTQVEKTPTRAGMFDDFPSLHHKAEKSKSNSEFPQDGSQSNEILDHYCYGEELLNLESSNFDSASFNTISADVSSVRNQSTSMLPDDMVFNNADSGLQPGTLKPSVEVASSNCGISGRSDSCIDGYESRFNASGNGEYVDKDAVRRVAKQMFDLNGFERSIVAKFLLQTNYYSQLVSREFFTYFAFSGLRIDAALRDYLNHVCLTGESSDRAQLLYFFSSRYYECNPTMFNNPDEIHALTCALILLNTDLHGDNVNKKMTVRDFVENLAHTQYNYQRSFLKNLYTAIKSTPFQYFENHGDAQPSSMKGSGVLRQLNHKVSKKSIGSNNDYQIDYKHGWVVKKSVFDIDGKRTPFGRRKWKMYYATLRGMVLYLHRDEHGFDIGKFNTYNNCILLHHAVATVPRDYRKRQNTFRLRTADFGEFLFQVGEPAEVDKWISAINFVSASFSTPVMPAPTAADNSSLPFYRPSLPSTPSTLSMAEQLRSHQDKVSEIQDRLGRLRAVAPPMTTRGKQVYEYFYRERFLENEKERYKTYVAILREKLASISQTDLCSRGSSRILTPPRTAFYLANISTTGDSSTVTTTVSNNPKMSAAVTNSHIMRKEGLEKDDTTPSLAEALRIASGYPVGCKPNGGLDEESITCKKT